jgi:hypothetical protein
MTGPYTDLKYFAEVFDEANVAYPRALALNIGDSFTTNNYVGTYAGAAYATINTDGKLALATALPTTAYRGPLFACVPGYLPDGTSQAVEFTVIALNVLFVAD